jgi:hypothetical protein
MHDGIDGRRAATGTEQLVKAIAVGKVADD